MCMAAASCDDDDGPGFEDFYPELPPTGGAQSAWARERGFVVTRKDNDAGGVRQQ